MGDCEEHESPAVVRDFRSNMCTKTFAEETQKSGEIQWSCWEQIISGQPGDLKTVKEVLEHEEVTSFTVMDSRILVTNTRGEQFNLDPVALTTGCKTMVAFHATRVLNHCH